LFGHDAAASSATHPQDLLYIGVILVCVEPHSFMHKPAGVKRSVGAKQKTADRAIRRIYDEKNDQCCI
jgi:hypothetical protein